ncbi:hypothetical protein BS78_10G135300 [Paspalum vaginatum]|nr:hypothetical protein BS78_10G135300 [Paspalum vaginatum]
MASAEEALACGSAMDIAQVVRCKLKVLGQILLDLKKLTTDLEANIALLHNATYSSKSAASSLSSLTTTISNQLMTMTLAHVDVALATTDHHEHEAIVATSKLASASSTPLLTSSTTTPSHDANLTIHVVAMSRPVVLPTKCLTPGLNKGVNTLVPTNMLLASPMPSSTSNISQAIVFAILIGSFNMSMISASPVCSALQRLGNNFQYAQYMCSSDDVHL